MIGWQQLLRQRLLRLEEGQQQVHACLKRLLPPSNTHSPILEPSPSRLICSSNSSSHVYLFSHRSSSRCCCTTWARSVRTGTYPSSSGTTCHVENAISADRGAVKSEKANTDRSADTSSTVREYMDNVCVFTPRGAGSRDDRCLAASEPRYGNCDEGGCSGQRRDTLIQWNSRLASRLCTSSNHLTSCLFTRTSIISYSHISRRYRTCVSRDNVNRTVRDVRKSGFVCASVAGETSRNGEVGRKQSAAIYLDDHSSSRAPSRCNRGQHWLHHISCASSCRRYSGTLVESETNGLLRLGRLSRTLCAAASTASPLLSPVLSAIVAARRHAHLTVAPGPVCPVVAVYSEGQGRVAPLRDTRGQTQQLFHVSQQHERQQPTQQQKEQHQLQDTIIDTACLQQARESQSEDVRVPEHQRVKLRMFYQVRRSSHSCLGKQMKRKEEVYHPPSLLSNTSVPDAAASAATCSPFPSRIHRGPAPSSCSYSAAMNSYRRNSTSTTATAAAAGTSSTSSPGVSPLGAAAHQQPAISSASSSAAGMPTQMSTQQQQTQAPHAAFQQPQGRSTLSSGSTSSPIARPRLRGTTYSSSSSGLRTCFKYLQLIISNPMVVKKFWKKGKESAIHTWRWTVTGFSLFYANVRVSYQLLKKKILGHPLRYNEHKLLVRTTADALKLIPFSLMIVIPLGELLLPVMLRLFPNMLPSTFFEKQVDNAYLSRKLKAKQELAAFFQELVREHTKHIIEHESNDALKDKAKALREFQEKLLRKDQKDVNPFLSLKEILSFAKLFKEEFVLEKLDLQTLQVMCKLLGIEPYSLQSHVVLQLRYHLNNIQREDREFMWEGVETLSHDELVEACKDRAMMFHSISDEDMREQMRQWLEISSHKDIPPLLLLWCRCITLTHRPIPPPAVDLNKSSNAAPTTAAKATPAAGTPAGGGRAAAKHAAETTRLGEKEASLAGVPIPGAPATATASLEWQQQWGTRDPATAGGHVSTQREAAGAAAAAAAAPDAAIAAITAAATDNNQPQRDATAQSLDRHGIPVISTAEESRASATTDQQQQHKPGEKREEEEAEDEDEKIKKATLKAMERQVELLRAEEETLRQSVWLLQEEEAHRKEVQAAEEAERLKFESFNETADSSSPASDTSSTSSSPDLHPHPTMETETATDIKHEEAAAARVAGADAPIGDSASRKNVTSPAEEKKEQQQQHIKTRPSGSEDMRDIVVTNAPSAVTGAGSPSAADTDDDVPLNELARVRSGREMLQRRARRMELELKLLRRLADMQHQQQEQAFGALSKVLQAAHACRMKQQALQQLEQAGVQQQQQSQVGDPHLQQHLEIEQGHQVEVQRQQKQQKDPSEAATAAAAAELPESVAQLESCVEDVIRKFADGVQQVEQLMRDAKRFRMNDTDPLFYPEDHSDMEDICTLSSPWPLSHAEQSHLGVSASSSSGPISPSAFPGAAGVASPSGVLHFPSSSASAGAPHSQPSSSQQVESQGGGRSVEERAEHHQDGTRGEGSAERTDSGESRMRKTVTH